IGLPLQKLMQQVKAGSVAGASVEGLHVLGDVLTDPWRCIREPSKTLLRDLLLAESFRDVLRGSFGVHGQMIEMEQNAQQLFQPRIIRSNLGDELVESVPQQRS